MSTLVLTFLGVVGIIVVLEAQTASLVHASRRVVALCFIVSRASCAKSKDIVKYGRVTYTSRVGWRGEIFAVEDAVDAEMARICVLARIGHNLESIAVDEGEPIGEEPIAAFSSTAGTSGAGNDSLLALRYRY